MVSGLTTLAQRIQGAYSLVVLAAEGIYATRDVYGFRPLILGRDATRFAVSSESRALQNMDMDIVRDVCPGEIVLINDKGFQTLRQLPSPRKAHCAFEWAYTASIDSFMDGLYVQEARNRLDAVSPGGTWTKGIRRRTLWPRCPCRVSAMPSATTINPRSVTKRFFSITAMPTGSTPNRAACAGTHGQTEIIRAQYSVEGKRIIICDDSIVRGTQIRTSSRSEKKRGPKRCMSVSPAHLYSIPAISAFQHGRWRNWWPGSVSPQGNIQGLDDLRCLESWVAGRLMPISVKYNSIVRLCRRIGHPA